MSPSLREMHQWNATKPFNNKNAVLFKSGKLWSETVPRYQCPCRCKPGHSSPWHKDKDKFKTFLITVLVMSDNSLHFSFCELRQHAKFQNHRATTSGITECDPQIVATTFTLQRPSTAHALFLDQTFRKYLLHKISLYTQGIFMDRYLFDLFGS